MNPKIRKSNQFIRKNYRPTLIYIDVHHFAFRFTFVFLYAICGAVTVCKMLSDRAHNSCMLLRVKLIYAPYVHF